MYIKEESPKLKFEIKFLFFFQNSAKLFLICRRESFFALKQAKNKYFCTNEGQYQTDIVGKVSVTNRFFLNFPQ